MDELPKCETANATPTPQELIDYLRQAASLGRRLPPFDEAAGRRADRSGARLTHRFLLRALRQCARGTAPLSPAGLQALRLGQQAILYASGGADPTRN